MDGCLWSMGLSRNPYDPCVYSGCIRAPKDESDALSDQLITLGLYVDDFVYFSSSDAVEQKF